jgi:hypothetical protein
VAIRALGGEVEFEPSPWRFLWLIERRIATFVLKAIFNAESRTRRNGWHGDHCDA